MRDIKFRAWDKLCTVRKMIDWDELRYEENGYTFSHPDYILMQYTGLKDKNGVEIYEGDIIKQKWSKFKKEVGFITCGETVDDWIFHALPEDILNRHGSLSCAIDCDNAEVIGNIYENPELLKE